MKRVLFAGVFGLAGCSPAGGGPANGPVLLQCNGVQTTQTFGTRTNDLRRTFKVDGKAKTFEIWDTDTQAWKAWGTNPTLEIKDTSINYIATTTGGGATAKREIVFDRTSGAVSDVIDVPFGRLTFDGSCKPVAKPEAVNNKF